MKLINLLLVWLVLYSCSSVNKQEKKIKKEYFEDGSLKTEQEYIFDTIQEGYYKRYFNNGQLEIEIPYVNNKKNGLVKEYYSSGTLFSKVPYLDGLKSGVAKWFHENGKLSSEIIFKNDIKTSEGFGFHENGVVSAYIFYNEIGEVLYRKDYDEEGNVVKEEGTGFPDIIVNDNYFKMGEELVVTVHVVTPPDCVENFYIGEMDSLGVFINKEKKEVINNTITYKKVFTTSGQYKWGMLLELESKKSKSVKVYDFNMNVTVDE